MEGNGNGISKWELWKWIGLGGGWLKKMKKTSGRKGKETERDGSGGTSIEQMEVPALRK